MFKEEQEEAALQKEKQEAIEAKKQQLAQAEIEHEKLVKEEEEEEKKKQEAEEKSFEERQLELRQIEADKRKAQMMAEIDKENVALRSQVRLAQVSQHHGELVVGEGIEFKDHAEEKEKVANPISEMIGSGPANSGFATYWFQLDNNI